MAMILIYIFSRINKQRTRAERYFYNQLLNIFLFYILLGMVGGLAKLPTNSFKVIYDFVNNINQFSTEFFFVAVVTILFKTSVTFYFYFMLKDRSRSIKRIKDYQFS